MEPIDYYGDCASKFSCEAIDRFPDLKHVVISANDDDPGFLLHMLNRLRIKVSNRKAMKGMNRKKIPRRRVDYLSIVR